jgi:quercetin dioxygenase-like cupin family protein
MTIQKMKFPSPNEPRQKVLFDLKKESFTINYGTVLLKKGIRIPEKGFTKHPQHEISYIASGKIQMLLENGKNGPILHTGDIISLEANEAQAGIVLEDCKIIYVLVG